MVRDLPRFYCERLIGPQVAISPGEAHHALHVLRLAAGAEVVLFDGLGSWAAGQITEATKREVRVSVGAVTQVAPRENAVHLGFAVPKGKRLDWLLEKATELGSTSLRPVRFARSIAGGGSDPGKQQRWLTHCISAAKQSGLNYLPEIRPQVTLDEFLSESAGTLAMVGDLSESAGGISEAIARRQPRQAVTILVGPEGGLTDDERQAALDAGFLPVRLGTTTLRIETAAVALLAATIATWK